jgi:glycosyltransferase involved in cell wall biosynthesis
MPEKQHKVAIIHDWLTGMRGGEKVLESLLDIYPDSDIFTLIWLKGSVSDKIEKQRITTSFLHKAPFIRNNYRNYLPLFPMAIESFDLAGYDLIISSSHCVAKGVIPQPGARHICYCYTPMRYIWDMYFQYFGKPRNRLAGFIYGSVANYLRMWDVTASSRVDEFIAISNHVSQRIRRYYGRASTVIFPPVDNEFYRPVSDKPLAEPYYLVVSGLVPYKRIDLAIEAFNQTGKKLIIIGEGPEKNRLIKMAKGNISFLGWASNQDLRKWYSHCEALIFPGEEDFGIVPVEAQACGRPVVAFGRGGALDTIIHGSTGIIFPEQTAASLIEALDTHEATKYNTNTIIENSHRFSKNVFIGKIRQYIMQNC